MNFEFKSIKFPTDDLSYLQAYLFYASVADAGIYFLQLPVLAHQGQDLLPLPAGLPSFLFEGDMPLAN